MSEVFGTSSANKSAASSFSKSIAWYYFFKRLIDFILVVALLTVFSPLMIMIAILIKIDSRGPIFFKQKRVGSRRISKNGEWAWEVVNFDCLKFRTMVHNADPALHQAYVTALIQNNTQKMDELQGCQANIRKLVRDPRITRIGYILRKYSLDELPQFFNVLFGQMSLVGPRPAIGYEVEVYKPWHNDRFKAKPGITGWQQVKARCTADFDEQVKFDLEYIEKKSLRFDFKIMLMTPMVVLRHRGAY